MKKTTTSLFILLTLSTLCVKGFSQAGGKPEPTVTDISTEADAVNDVKAIKKAPAGLYAREELVDKVTAKVVKVDKVEKVAKGVNEVKSAKAKVAKAKVEEETHHDSSHSSGRK